MSVPTQQQRIGRLAIEFMGWESWMRPGDQVRRWWKLSDGTLIRKRDWNPFTSLDDAQLLLFECDRRNLFGKLEDRFYTISVHWRAALKSGLLATADEITEAVWTVAGLERNNGTEVFNSEVGS